jgi:hypothetical protein
MKDKLLKLLELGAAADMKTQPMKTLQLLGVVAEIVQALQTKESLTVEEIPELTDKQRAELMMYAALGAVAVATNAVPKL